MLILCVGFVMLRAKQESWLGWGRASALAFDRAVSVLTLTQLQCRAFVCHLGCLVAPG